MENKIETKHHEPIVYMVYEFLKKNCMGLENATPKPEVAEYFNLTTRELRKITHEINTSGELEKIISTTHSCYMCKNNDEAEKSIRNTYRMAISLFKKAKAMEKKVGLNNQIKIPLGKYYKEMVETFTDGE